MEEKVDYEFVEHNWKKYPIQALAYKFELSPFKFMQLIRKKGICKEVQPFEIKYINEMINKIPLSELRQQLGVTKTQLDQLIRGKLSSKSTSSSQLSLDDVISKTKWLIEDKLKLNLDDFLPRSITSKQFYEADLYHCIKFATALKAKDRYYKSFSAIAFLVCKAYPSLYKPFQFRHSKTNDYFKGKTGRKNLINAAIWVIEDKMHLSPESLKALSNSRYFLRSRDLAFYGISSHWFRMHFDSHDEFINSILSNFEITKHTNITTKQLREILLESGRNIDKCELKSCLLKCKAPEIHHIIPRSIRTIKPDKLHAPDNLLVLCSKHHTQAHQFEWQKYSFEGANLRDELMLFLESSIN